MKVTRDKTQSVDLGNGLSLRADGVLSITHKGTTKGIACLDGDKWADEIFAKHFTPVHITLETEDEACTLWHYLNLTVPVIRNHLSEIYKAPNKFDSLDMFTRLNEVYTPEKKK